MTMIIHDQLIHAIEQDTGLKHGVDFLVAHPIDEQSGQQCGEAYLFRWMNNDVAQPDIEEMKQRYQEVHWSTYEARVAREKRNYLLTQTDWTQNADTPNSLKANFAVYRNALRDLPAQPNFPKSIDWPIAPQ